VVDKTDDEHNSTYTGLYYFFSQLAATFGTVFYGWTIQFSNNDYCLMMVIAPFFLLLAFIMMFGVHRGEAIKTKSRHLK
jgi:MFS-type transporter involved in bile tolerance (Atg22 family)